MGIHSQSTMRVTMEAVLVLSMSMLLGVEARPQPQQITQEVLLTPFNFVRSTGNIALSSGQRLVHSVPEAVNTVSDPTVNTINTVPETINTVTDFGVDSIRNAPSNTIRLVNGVPTAIAQTPSQVVNLGTGAISTVGQVPFTAFRATGNALRAGANVLTRAPTSFSNFADSAVNTGTGFVLEAPNNIIRAPTTVIGAGTSGIRTVATDGVNMITSLPSNALRFTGTAFRTGEALVNGGTRLILASGDSLFRTGMNTIGGGGRIILAGAGVPFQIAGDAVQRLRDMF